MSSADQEILEMFGTLHDGELTRPVLLCGEIMWVNLKHLQADNTEIQLKYKRKTLFQTGGSSPPHLYLKHLLSYLERTKDFVYCKAAETLVPKHEVKFYEIITRAFLGERAECCICSEVSDSLMLCKHNVCLNCAVNLPCKKRCPLCREPLRRFDGMTYDCCTEDEEDE